MGSASTCSMPLSTWPQTVYCPSRNSALSKQMKNWLLALSGTWVRAIEQVGAAVHSIDEVVVGDRIVERVPRTR